MYKKETIGKMMEIKDARNRDLVGTRGRVLDETKNTFLLKTKDGRKKVPKKGATFTINGHEVKGEDLHARPEERIKG